MKENQEGAAAMALANGLENRGVPEDQDRGSNPPPSATTYIPVRFIGYPPIHLQTLLDELESYANKRRN